MSFACRFCLSIFAIAVGCNSAEKPDLAEIKVEGRLGPDGEKLPDFGDRKKRKLENGLIEAIYVTAPELMTRFVPDESPGENENTANEADPFADPTPGAWKRASAREVLESFGVTFEKETSASYDSKTFTLKVVQTEEQIELVDLYFDSIKGPHYGKNIVIRAEIYELSDFAALKIQEGADHFQFHENERKAIIDSIPDGKAELIASPRVLGRSGQSAKITTGISSQPNRERENENDVKISPDEEEAIANETGLLFEVDSVLGADNKTIDINFSLVHATKGESGIHKREISTQISLIDGRFVLVGSWKIENTGKTQLIFLTSSVHTANPYSR